MNRTRYFLLASSGLFAAVTVSSPALAQSGPPGGGGGATGTPLTATQDQASQPGSSNSSPGPKDPAATPTGEIVVTAQRRAERQVDVPIAITALSAEQLTTGNVQNLGDIQKLTPSLRFDSQVAFVQPSIRGIGTGITTSGGGSNVGIYIDGFYSPNPIAADFQLTKVSSIQVLKGPQGTLFGHNTTGGAILVTTADPSEKPELDLKASYGRFNAQKYQGYGTFGIVSGVAMDVEGVYSKGHGFITNIVDDDHHVGAYQNWTVRTGLRAEIGSDVTVLARYQHSDLDDPSGQLLNSNTDSTIDPSTERPQGTETFTIPGTFTTNHDQVANDAPSFIHTRTNIAQLTIKADLGFANLASYSQYRRERTNQSENLDHVGLPIFQLGLPIHDSTYSQEFLLTSKSGPRLQWTAGLFFFSNKDTYITDIDPGSTLGPGLPPTTTRIRLGGSSATTQSYAGFVDATYELTDRLFVTGGIRYSHDIVKNAYYCEPGTGCTVQVGVPSIDSNHATPRAVIRFKPSDRSSIYASYTKGYKAAIIDVGGSCQDGPAFICNKIKPENIDAFEIGYKYDDRRLSVETSAFYYNYKNLQVSEYLGNALAFIINAAKSEIYGFDGEVHYRFGDHLQLNAGAAYTHGRYKKFGGQSVTLPDGTTTVNGAPLYEADGCSLAVGCYFSVVSNAGTILRNVHMQHVPDFTATFGPRVTTGDTAHGEFALSGNLYYTTKFFFSPSGTQFKQPHYATVDLRLEWNDPSKRFTVSAYGTNVTDKRYRVQVQYNAFGAGAEWNQPASWGLEAGVRF